MIPRKISSAAAAAAANYEIQMLKVFASQLKFQHDVTLKEAAPLVMLRFEIIPINKQNTRARARTHTHAEQSESRVTGESSSLFNLAVYRGNIVRIRDPSAMSTR